MSLLDELARHSYSNHSFFSQPTPSITQPSPLQQHRHSQHNQSQTHWSASVDSKTAQDLGSLFCKDDSGPPGSKEAEGSDYYEKYRQKFKRINGMVSVLSAKIRKLNYQFMIHLERQAKRKAVLQSPDHFSHPASQTLCHKQASLVVPEPRTFSILEQTFLLIGSKIIGFKRIGFCFLRQNHKRHLKLELFEQLIDSIVAKTVRQRQIDVLLLLKTSVRTCNSPFKQVKIRQTLPIPIFVAKKSTVITSLASKPFNSIEQTEQAPLFWPSLLYPQNRESENIDFCDNLTLFMENDAKKQLSSFSKEPSNLSFSNICHSEFEVDKESQSQKSYIKQLTEIELTAAPVSAFAKRKISDFTSSVVAELQNHSQGQEKKFVEESRLNQIKSEAILHFDSKTETPDHFKHLPGKHQDFDDFQTKQHQNLVLRRFSTPINVIVRASSQVNIVRRQSMSELNEDILAEEYEEEMMKYQKFKNYLKKRREYSMKEIQKNQEVLKKLIVKYENYKEKTSKLRISLKSKDSKEKQIESSLKKYKKSTPSKLTLNSSKSNSKNKKNNHSLRKKDDQSEQMLAKKLCTNDDFKVLQGHCPRNMDIYYQYVNQKKKMESEKATPNKKVGKKGLAQSLTQKKKDSRVNTSSAQKNILAMNKCSSPKRQRLDLRVDLVRETPNKAGGGTQRQKLKIVGNSSSKPREKVHFK